MMKFTYILIFAFFVSNNPSYAEEVKLNWDYEGTIGYKKFKGFSMKDANGNIIVYTLDKKSNIKILSANIIRDQLHFTISLIHIYVI